MATIDPCGTFIDGEFFSQHKIEGNSQDYEYTRSFIIYATSSQAAGVLTNGVSINIMPVNESQENLGTPKTESTWDKQLEKLLRRQIPPIPASSTVPFLALEQTRADNLVADFFRTSLDFTLRRKSCILIRLIGNFWTFSPNISPVTTKHNYGTQYQNLQKHWLNPTTDAVERPPAGADYNCVSLFCGDPCRDSLNVSHGFSFNIELIMDIAGEEKRLPVTIDPDVENKGNN